MRWEIQYTEEAVQDLQDVYDYLAFVLLEPVLAQTHINTLMDAAESLDSMPFRHPLYQNEPWHSRGLRMLPVGGWIVFYIPNESYNTVTVIRIVYGGRDMARQLEENK